MNNGAASITSGAEGRPCEPPSQVLACNIRTKVCKGAQGMDSFLLWSMLCIQLCQHLYKMSWDLGTFPALLTLPIGNNLCSGEIHGPNAVLCEDQGGGKTGLLRISAWLTILSLGVNVWRPFCFLGFTQHMLLTPAAKQVQACKKPGNI